MKFAYLIEPPFNFVDADGTVTGCDVELARHVFGELDIAFEPVETEFAELLPGLGSGRWRMTTGLFGTDERRTMAQFCLPIWALPDGLLVAKGNPLGLDGYRSLSAHGEARLAVVRDQVQHRSALDFGMSRDRISIYETYEAAATAVVEGRADAYASVGRAHASYLMQHEKVLLDIAMVPATEKSPAFGSFAFSLDDTILRREVDTVLAGFLGSTAHRKMVARFGFADNEVNLVVGHL